MKRYIGKEQFINPARMFWQNEDGITTVELILILVCLIAVVMIFKGEITGLVADIFEKITENAGQI